MNLTVGALTSNSEHRLPDLLRSLEAGMAGVDSWRLVVADSGSRDKTLEVVARMAPQATIVTMPNLGFAAQANAVAAADPTSDAVLILSQTVRLLPGCAALMLEALQQPGVGVVVPRLFDGNGDAVICLRRRPTLARAWGQALLGGWVTRWLPSLTELVANPQAYHGSTKFDWATGAVTMFSRDCLTKIGGWDESLWLYSEETDFELRATDHGFDVRFVPQAAAVHLGGDARVKPHLFAHQNANRVRLYAMRHRRPAAHAFWTAVMVGELLRLPLRDAPRRAAINKLWQERAELVAGRPARRQPNP